MNNYQNKFINISNICLDIENLRHDKVSTEPEAIHMLLSDDTEHKVLELASDIVELRMLDPSSKLIVTSDKNNKGHFIVLEGNRRITALKTLANPEFSKGIKGYATFKKLSPTFLKLGITQVECVIMPPAEAQIWIKRKHYTRMGGKGTLTWGALGSARSDARDGIYASWLTAINFLNEHGVDTTRIMQGIEKKTTTVDRVLTNGKRLYDMLGISLNKDGTVTNEIGDAGKANDLIEALMIEMASPQFRETDVTNSTLQVDFLNQFTHLSCKKPLPEDGDDEDDTGTTPSRTQPSRRKSNKKTTIVRLRKSLAQKGLQISHIGLHKFYVELCKLPVATYEHSAAAMLRVFLEKATVVFLEEMAIAEPGGRPWQAYGIKLSDKIKAAVSVIDPQKNNTDLRFARQTGSGNQDGLHSLNMLNEYIHSHKALPASSEIITTWDRFHPYFDAMFQTIEDNNDE